MDVFELKENVNTVFVRNKNMEEGKKKLYYMFKYQCDPSLKTKLKGPKWYNKAHNPEDGIKLLDLISRVAYDVEAHLQGTWVRIKDRKHIHTFFQRRNKKIDE